MMNIPIYRARRSDSDEWVEGYYCTGYKREHLIRTGGVYDSVQHFEVDPTTLAIHFPNMIDKNGKKIFASLSEDGVGGDILVNSKGTFIFGGKSVCIYKNGELLLWNKTEFYRLLDSGTNLNIEVIGIHKG